MKAITSNLRHGSSLSGLLRGLVAFACLFLIAPPVLHAQVGAQESEADDETDEDDGATGDETVGTLPVVADDDLLPPIGSPTPSPGMMDMGQFSREGALLLEGPVDELVLLLSHARTSGLYAVHVDETGYAYAYVLGDFQVRLLPEVLADLHVRASIQSELGLAARVSWSRRAHDVALSGGETLSLPLDAGAAALARSPLVVDAVNSWGGTTRLALSFQGGYVVLRQARR